MRPFLLVSPRHLSGHRRCSYDSSFGSSHQAQTHLGSDLFSANTVTSPLPPPPTRRSYVYASTHRLNGEHTGLPQQVDILERYRGLVTLGRIKYDEEQIRIIMQLRRLQKDLVDYAPPAVVSNLLRHPDKVTEVPPDGPPSRQSWWAYSPEEETVLDSKALVRVKGLAEELAALETPKGLLVTGPPGSGKSFLVDMWFSSFPTPYKARKHYSQFVLEIYRGVWEETQRRMAAVHTRPWGASEEEKMPWNKAVREHWRELVKTGVLPMRWSRSPSAHTPLSADPTIAFIIARRLVLHHWLLVFDEMQLLDVSSAVLLADVMSWFWRMGGVVVGTSNKVPDDLYKNGVQRERLEPFVEALKTRCPVLTMRSETDWRREISGDGIGRTWYTLEEVSEFDRVLEALVSSEKEGGSPIGIELSVFGRSLHIPWSSGQVCKFTFAELCNETLGPADYLTLASKFRTFVITEIPVLNLSEKDQARRFISLIDALYESRCRLLCLAEADPEDLFFPGAVSQKPEDDLMMVESVAETQDTYRPNVSPYDAPGMAEAPVSPTMRMPLDTLSIFSGQDEQFAFKRALSRLLEMTSPAYGETNLWTPLPANVRKWETTKGVSIDPGVSDSLRNPSRRPDPEMSPAASDDFAEEAAYHIIDRLARHPPPPGLRAHHVWGIGDDCCDESQDREKGTKIDAPEVSNKK